MNYRLSIQCDTILLLTEFCLSIEKAIVRVVFFFYLCLKTQQKHVCMRLD